MIIKEVKRKRVPISIELTAKQVEKHMLRNILKKILCQGAWVSILSDTQGQLNPKVQVTGEGGGRGVEGELSECIW